MMNVLALSQKKNDGLNYCCQNCTANTQLHLLLCMSESYYSSSSSNDFALIIMFHATLKSAIIETIFLKNCDHDEY